MDKDLKLPDIKIPDPTSPSIPLEEAFEVMEEFIEFLQPKHTDTPVPQRFVL